MCVNDTLQFRVTAVRTTQARFSYGSKKLSGEECKHSLVNLPSQFGPVNAAGHVHW